MNTMRCECSIYRRKLCPDPLSLAERERSNVTTRKGLPKTFYFSAARRMK
jgi:hypothetical protein